jgi:hypothetical protein
VELSNPMVGSWFVALALAALVASALFFLVR